MVFNNEKIEELLKMDMSHEELVKELTDLGYKVNEVIEFTAMKKVSYYKYDLSHIHITTKEGTITKVYYKYLEEFEEVAHHSPNILNEEGTLDCEASYRERRYIMRYNDELYLFDVRTTNRKLIEDGEEAGLYCSGINDISGARYPHVDITFMARMYYATRLGDSLSSKLSNGKSFMDYLKEDDFIKLFPVEYRGVLKRARAINSNHSKITLKGKGTRVRVTVCGHKYDLSLGLAKNLFSGQTVGYMKTVDLTESDYNSGKVLTMRDKKNTEDFQFFIKMVMDSYNVRKDRRIKELCDKIQSGELEFDVDEEMQKVLQEMASKGFHIIDGIPSF